MNESSNGPFDGLLEQLQRAGQFVHDGTMRAMGLKDLLDYAEQRPSQIGLTWRPGQKDYEDAMRHVLMAAEMQREHPVMARPILWAHEVNGDLWGQSADARKMDDWNNALGVMIGRNAKSRQDAEIQALNALPNMMALIPPNGSR